MHAISRTLLITLGSLGLAGCAGLGPEAPTTPVADVEVEAAASELLVAARADYYAGVRAYVRGDLGEARDRLQRCQRALEWPTGTNGLQPDQERDAQSLLAKTDYFLDQLAVADLAAAAPAEPASPVETTSWEVVHGEIAPVRNDDVERWMRYFLGEGRPVYQKWLDRRSQYVPIFEDALARHGLPPELMYHSMIESGFSTSAYSWAHAVGLWQFIRSTGRTYGLRSDWWVDERRDPVKSTEAASRYLKALYVEFQDWELALAAYNVGEARVRRQIRRQKTRDFWKLRLPRETRNHIPKFYAALILGSDPEKYGFTVNHSAPPDTETIPVDFCVDFEVLGECCGASVKTLSALNPALVRRCTPPDETGYPVVVPAGTGARTMAALAELPEDQRIRWAHHRVRRGETLSHIAMRYRTSVRAISEANNLRSTNYLSIGQDLLIPQGRPSGASPPRFASSSRGSSSGSSGNRKITYVVKNGDTLSEIAERYGYSSRTLRRWNRVGRYIHPGDRLTIYVKDGGGSGSARSDVVVRVRKGDTLWDIARHHGVSLTSLLHANNLSRSDLIRPGDLIKVPRS